MSTKYQQCPPLSAGDYAALKADIAERGVQIPIECDEKGRIVDGFHRERICRELKIDCPRTVREYPNEAAKRTQARKLNLLRRHLTQQQRRELIKAEIEDNPNKPSLQIAQALGVSPTTVDKVRAGFQNGNQKTRTDKRGRKQPAKKPRKAKPKTACDYNPEDPDDAAEPGDTPEMIRRRIFLHRAAEAVRHAKENGFDKASDDEIDSKVLDSAQSAAQAWETVVKNLMRRRKG